MSQVLNRPAKVANVARSPDAQRRCHLQPHTRLHGRATWRPCRFVPLPRKERDACNRPWTWCLSWRARGPR